MKKSMIALAVLGAFAGAASAQSSVTLFGIVDAAIARIDGNGASKTGMTNSGLNSSRLGFRGTEDLGGGLKAGFWLESSLNNDDSTGFSFNNARRSFLSLGGGFGELRVGREYTPSFWNLTVFDAFGTNGVGSNMAIGMASAAASGFATAAGIPAAGAAALGLATSNSAAVRANNSVTYNLPGGLGGFYGSVMYAFGERANNAVTTATTCGVAGTYTGTGGTVVVAPTPVGASLGSEGNYFGVRAGYANGPLDVAVGTGKTKSYCASDVTATNFGAAYDFGVVKPMFLYAEEKNGVGAKVKGMELSATAPLGSGELRAAYSKYDVANASAAGWKKAAIGYGYNMSKRTQLYGTYARVSNNAAQSQSVSNNGLGGLTAAAGGGSSGLELGLRHSF